MYFDMMKAWQLMSSALESSDGCSRDNSDIRIARNSLGRKSEKNSRKIITFTVFRGSFEWWFAITVHFLIAFTVQSRYETLLQRTLGYKRHVVMVWLAVQCLPC